MCLVLQCEEIIRSDTSSHRVHPAITLTLFSLKAAKTKRGGTYTSNDDGSVCWAGGK